MSDTRSNISISTFHVVFSIIIISVGIWEALIATNNNPKNNDFYGDMIQGYAFTVTKCVINILIGSINLIFGLLLCVSDTDSKSSNLNNNPVNNILQLGSLGVNIWGLVMYFDNYELGPFYKVIFAEIIIFFVSIGIIVLTIMIGCCYCCYQINRETEIPSIKHNLDNSNLINNAISKLNPDIALTDKKLANISNV